MMPPWAAGLAPSTSLGDPLNLAFTMGLASMLLWAAAADLRHRRIPNASCGGIAALWPAYLLLAGAPAAAALPGAAAVFAAGFLLWRCGVLGGGDVKLVSALALWAGGELLAPFLLVTALLGGWLAVASIAARRAGLLLPARVAVGLSWAGLPVLPGDPGGPPYGVAIGWPGWLVGQLFWH
jgi:prepilin peptidase CpaA